MFLKHEMHDKALMDRWRRCIQIENFQFQLMRIRRGCHHDYDITNLEKKIRHIYPRGPVLDRMIYLHGYT